MTRWLLRCERMRNNLGTCPVRRVRAGRDTQQENLATEDCDAEWCGSVWPRQVCQHVMYVPFSDSKLLRIQTSVEVGGNFP